MKPKDYLIQQANMHPSLCPLDIIKLCYQATFGPQHLLEEMKTAQKDFNKEFSKIKSGSSCLYECISDDYCRVNLYAWKEHNLPSDWLFGMFINSINLSTGTDDTFHHLLQEAGILCADGFMPFSSHDWDNELNTYWHTDGTVHHSRQYQRLEHPSYRLVSTRFIRLFPLLEKISKLNPKDNAFVIALDGRAASGKTTIANLLFLILNAGIVHMDDFFLPGYLRSNDRLAEPGGNVHYERFMQDVLPNITQTKAFSYCQFDCSKMEFGNTQKVISSKWRIVEGAYSCHPLFDNYMDLKVFCDVEPEEQLHRIELRNGLQKANIFATQWIPLEENYIKEFQIRENSNIIL